MESDDLGKELQPGDICGQSGLYEVIHVGHRVPHKVVVSAQDVFPACKHCGENVRYRLVMHASSDPARLRASAARKRNG